MASAEATEVFDCSIQEFYDLITNYESYPLFLDEVKECKVVEESENTKLVKYSINVVKNFNYTLKMDESKAPNELSWSFYDGDLFKKSSGHWKLEEEQGKTRAHYFVEAKFGMLVPGPITKAVISVNLPNMMKSYAQRLKEIQS